MSLVHLGNACSHLQNASKARLGLPSVPRTKQLHALLLQMQKAGYVSNVTISGNEPPPPSSLSPILSTNPAARREMSGHVALHDGAEQELDVEEQQGVTRENISSRRLWIGLKYWNQRPVLEKMSLVSKPTRRVWIDVPGMERLIKGEKVGYTKGLRGIGEAMYATTDQGIMEVRECVNRRMGGMLLCRVNQPF